MQADRMHYQDVQDGGGHLEAGPLEGRSGHVVLGSACQEGRVDVVPQARGHHVAEASVQSVEAEGDGNVAVVDLEDP